MILTQAQLAEHRKSRLAVGEPPEMWATFAGVLLDAGYFVHSYGSGKTESAYLKVGRMDMHKPPLWIRCSNHVETHKKLPTMPDIHFYLGVSSYGTTTIMDGVLFVRNYFYGAAK